MPKRKQLGEMLKDNELITEEQILDVLANKSEGQKLGSALVEKGYITEKQLIDVLEIQLNLKSASLYQTSIDRSLSNLVTKEYAQKNILVPIKLKGSVIVMAMNDPLDFFVIEDLEMSTGYSIEPVLATKDDIFQAINRLYNDEEMDFEEVDSEDAPAVRIFNHLLEVGVTNHASDIHLDPREDGLQIRYRIDGVLRNDMVLPKSLINFLTTRIKIMAGLNITESRLPQDGRIGVDVNGTQINLRVATLPTVFGEKVVLRILNITNVFTKIDNLGLQGDILVQYKKLISEPSGLVLITGPTGSGKSSTLYGSINELNSPSINIITIEDPVEYQLEGINQVPVNPERGLTFANGLRSILRQDPNIIMVGEIRDKETADISIRAALTGHLVFSTLHTNSAVDAIPRLYDMGIEPYLVVSSLNGVMAQRLVRRVCKDCASKRKASPIEKDIFQRRGMAIEEVTVGKGCDVCHQTGYRGRLAIHELVVITDQMKKLMVNQATTQEIRDHVKKSGVRFLIDDGLEKVRQGHTTIEEVLRVASLND